MVDMNLIFIIAFSLTICYGVGLSYRQIRERKAEVSQSTYRKKVISLCLGAAAVFIWFVFCSYISIMTKRAQQRPTNPRGAYIRSAIMATLFS